MIDIYFKTHSTPLAMYDYDSHNIKRQLSNYQPEWSHPPYQIIVEEHRKGFLQLEINPVLYLVCICGRSDRRNNPININNGGGPCSNRSPLQRNTARCYNSVGLRWAITEDYWGVVRSLPSPGHMLGCPIMGLSRICISITSHVLWWRKSPS